MRLWALYEDRHRALVAKESGRFGQGNWAVYYMPEREPTPWALVDLEGGPMKTYIARRGLSGTIVLVRDERGERALTHHVKHSPTGFEWGYGGSGPAELARCILIDHFDQPCQACGATGRDEDGYYCIECRGEKFIHPTPREYQGFKEAVIGVAPHEGFEITTAEVDEIVTGSAA